MHAISVTGALRTGTSASAQCARWTGSGAQLLHQPDADIRATALVWCGYVGVSVHSRSRNQPDDSEDGKISVQGDRVCFCVFLALSCSCHGFAKHFIDERPRELHLNAEFRAALHIGRKYAQRKIQTNHSHQVAINNNHRQDFVVHECDPEHCQ